jgi:transposase
MPLEGAGMNKKYVVDLSEEERTALQQIVRCGRHSSRRFRWAHLLLKAHDGWKDRDIGEALGVSVPTVQRIRQRFMEEGLEVALGAHSHLPRPYLQRLDGKQEAKLIALACSKAPEGLKRWTLRLLAGKMVELQLVERVSYQTVRRVLKKTP